MKIAVCITRAVPGGATVFVWELVSFLHTRGHEVHVLAGDGEWLMEKCAKAQIPFHRLAWMQRELHPYKDTRALFELTSKLKELNPDAIHLNSSKIGVLGSIAGKIAGIKNIVYCIGGWAFLEPMPKWKRMVIILAERIAARFRDTIVCVHPGDVEAAIQEKITPRKSLIAIPNGVDIDALATTRLSKQEARFQLGIPSNAFTFGSIANFYPAKDIPNFIDATKRYRALGGLGLVAIIGDGMLRNEIKNEIQKQQVEPYFILCGAKEQASNYLSAFDVFAIPSAKEGMPIALLEAMATPLSSIVSDVGAMRWMMEPYSGLIVPPKNPEELARAMLRIERDQDLREELAQNAYQAVKERFPLQKTMKEHERLLILPKPL